MTAPPQVLADTLADRYRIGDELGQGGMATVYLAQDLKHDRRVALKVLRPELAAVIGAERFLQEIKVTANLQHPHILALYDSGEAEQFLYYVMPYVQGESLDDKLKREKQLGVEEAVRIAGEVASALDYAHREGVVHRDIKPANIMLQDGQALIADFGIALALSHAGGTRITETGLSLGTPHYMSPEQATGDRDIDARSDIYSLGAVLYESLAGEPPHTGGTIQAVISKVVTEIPKPLGDLRRSVPVHVGMAVEKALAKIPADRFASAADFAQALRDPGFTLASSRATAASAGPAPTAALGWRQLVAGALLVVAGLVAGWMIRGRPATPDPVVARFRIPIESHQGLTGAPVNTLALSPDGRTIVYVGRSTGSGQVLYQRRLGELEAHAMPGTEGGSYPVFSPAGSRIGYFGPGGVYFVSPTGGAPTAVGDVQSQALAQFIWLDEQTLIATGADGGLLRVPLDGPAEVITIPDTALGEAFLSVNALLPDGRTILVIAGSGAGVNGPVYAVDAYSGERIPVIEAPTNAVWYSDGHLLWALPNGALNGAAFDVDRLEVEGTAVPLAEGVRQAVAGPAQVGVSAAGSMVYVPEQPFNLMLLDRSGNRELLAEGHRYHSPRFSPDGRFLAVDFTQQGSRDVWSLDLGQGTMSRITFENDGHDPVWAPDGRSIYYVTGIGVYRRRADGSGVAESVFVGTAPTSVVDITSDGSTALTAPTGANGSWDVALLPLGDDRQEERVFATSFNEEQPALSPDGRWLAYASDETGRHEVYVRPFPDGGAKHLVSRTGGAEPLWSPDGRQLYFLGQFDGAPYLTAAAVTTDPTFGVLDRTPLFDVSEFEPSSPHANYHVSPDGSRFVMVHQGPLTEMVFVMNWTEEVRRRSVGGER